MSADDTFHQSRMAEMIETARAAISLSSGIHQREIARVTGGEKTFFQCGGERLSVCGTDEAATDHRDAISNQRHRLGGRHHSRLTSMAHAHQPPFT